MGTDGGHYGISGLVAEYIVAIDVTRVWFPADASEVETAKGKNTARGPGGFGLDHKKNPKQT